MIALSPRDAATVLVLTLQRQLEGRMLGGKGSGDYGHKGRPGEVGGSADGEGEHSIQPWEMQRAISAYGQMTHYQINEYLRNGKKTRQSGQSLADSKDYAKTLDAAFQHRKVFNTFKKDTFVYRGIQDPRVWKTFNRMRVGSVFGDQAFLSTSFSDTIAEYATHNHSYDDPGVLLSLKVSKGMRYLSGRGDEREAILNRGLKWKVTSIDRLGSEGPGGVLRVDAKVVLK